MARKFPAQDWAGRTYQDKEELARKMNEMNSDELVLRSADGKEFIASRTSYVKFRGEKDSDFPSTVSTRDLTVREMAQKDAASRERVVDRPDEE